MLDGAELGRALAAHPGDAEAALAGSERAMFARSTEIAAQSAEFDEMLSGDDGENTVQILIDAFTALTAGEAAS